MIFVFGGVSATTKGYPLSFDKISERNSSGLRAVVLSGTQAPYASSLPETRDLSRIDSHSADLILPFDSRKYHRTRYNTPPWPVKVPESDAYRDSIAHATVNWVVAIPYVSTISSLLTLFSKFFSSFLHSTCSLSVSHQYLALEEVYLPFKASIPKNPTLWSTSYLASHRQIRECHPLGFLVP